MSSIESERREAALALIDAARRLEHHGLIHNTNGNISIRVGDEVMTTPSGVAARALEVEQMAVFDLDGRRHDETGSEATSEWQLHLAVMNSRPEIGAIVHTHSPEATAMSTLGVDLPPVHYVVAGFGTPGLRVAPYATYGSSDLAAAVVDTLATDATACLMANHGAIALGWDLASAIARAVDIEWFCGVYRRATHAGRPVALDDDEIARVAERFKRYGQRSRRD